MNEDSKVHVKCLIMIIKSNQTIRTVENTTENNTRDQE